MIDRRGLPGNRLKGCIISIYPCGISCRWLNACHIQTAKSVPIFVEGRVAGLLPCFLLGAFCGKNPRPVPHHRQRHLRRPSRGDGTILRHTARVRQHAQTLGRIMVMDGIRCEGDGKQSGAGRRTRSGVCRLEERATGMFFFKSFGYHKPPGGIFH